MPTTNTRTLADLRVAMTPGPWIAADDNFIRLNDNHAIAEFFGASPQRQNRTNAIAVAAVPKLLAVLEAAITISLFLEPIDGPLPKNEERARRQYNASVAALFDANRAALAKLGVRP